jgi:mRNA-degrading endonuclease toxin of MazEF toxin-antitoxin module
VPALMQGRVIYPKIAIPDPQGQNPKEGRPFVVVTTNDGIKKGGPIFAVGITTAFDESHSDLLYVPLPYGPSARTGLKRDSAAVCAWVIDIPQDRIDIGPGYVHPSLVAQIAEKIEKLKSVPQVIRDDPPP